MSEAPYVSIKALASALTQQSAPRLRSLTLAGDGLSEIDPLVAVLKTGDIALQELNLEGNKIGADGAKALAQTPLEILDLTNNELGDAGAAAGPFTVLEADGHGHPGLPTVAVYMLDAAETITRCEAGKEYSLDGMKALADYVHARGMKLGIYTDYGTNCVQFGGGQSYRSLGKPLKTYSFCGSRS